MHDDINFFNELTQIYEELERNGELNSQTLRTRFKELRSLFYDFIFFFLRNQFHFFPTNFARINFIIQNYHINDSIKNKLLSLFFLLKKKSQKKLTKKNLYQIISLLGDIFSFFFERSKPEELTLNPSENSLSLEESLLFQSKGENGGLINLYNIVVKENDRNECKIFCLNNINEIEIDCNAFWQEIPKTVTKGTFLNCFGLIQKSENKYETTESSLIVIEPDYLYDVTDISQCFTQKGSNAYYYFIYKFLPKQTTYYTFLGNLVNQIFDYLLTEKEISFEEAFNLSISKKILSYLVLKHKDQAFIYNIKKDAKEHYQSLLKVVQILKKYSFQIEPTFFSAEYGLIGRMDVLLESEQSEHWKTIIELKSGTPPKGNVILKFANGLKFPTSMWASHYAQIVGYNLLIKSAISQRIGSSMILYSSCKEKPLRDAGTIFAFEREFIKTRNWVYLLEMLLSKGKFSIFETIEKFLKTSKNYLDSVNLFELFNSSNEELKSLIKEYIKFVINENIITKVGDYTKGSKSSQSSLWNISIEEKSDLETCLIDLIISQEKSDFLKGYLYFERDKTEFSFCSLRKGDPIIIYHPKLIQNEHSFQIFKGVIKQIEPEFLIVSLRNKFSDWSKFSEKSGWIIEQDSTDSNIRYLYHSLFNLLLCQEEKIKYLLGKIRPEKKFRLATKNKFGQYSDIIQNAIEYNPYYLIIGPPGTGKTKGVLKELLLYYLYETHLKILVCTYTNRAVDEIVEILINENLNDKFIRIGTKESSQYVDNLLPYLAENLSPDELEKRIFETRIFLGTAYSFLTNAEIFELIKFDISIVDEASQLLLPHLAGILSLVDKFILIGDDKQLPSVVLQDGSKIISKDKNLIELGYENLTMSYFEFLLKRNRKNGWNDTIGTLNIQSRMHPSVLEPINKIFYEGIILTNPKRKVNEQTSKIIMFIEEMLKIPKNSRIIFVDTPLENRKKTNISQAEIISDIINKCYSNFGNLITADTFGVISPFRIQNSEIYSRLEPDVRSIISIDTVERFQGSEREIILLSLPFNSSIEILTSTNFAETDDGKLIDRKLNVALTRAKELLIIFGNLRLLTQNNYNREFFDFLVDNSKIVKLY